MDASGHQLILALPGARQGIFSGEPEHRDQKMSTVKNGMEFQSRTCVYRDFRRETMKLSQSNGG